MNLSQGRLESHHSPLRAEDLGKGVQQSRAALSNSISFLQGDKGVKGERGERGDRGLRGDPVNTAKAPS